MLEDGSCMELLDAGLETTLSGTRPACRSCGSPKKTMSQSSDQLTKPLFPGWHREVCWFPAPIASLYFELDSRSPSGVRWTYQYLLCRMISVRWFPWEPNSQRLHQGIGECADMVKGQIWLTWLEMPTGNCQAKGLANRTVGSCEKFWSYWKAF